MTPVDAGKAGASVPDARRRRRRRFALVAAAAGLLLAALVGEVAVRLLDAAGSPRRTFAPGIYRPDDELGWTLLPSYEGVHVEYRYTARTTTNELGFRGPAWDAARKGAKRRILVLGDSCTFGRGVLDEETWPARLESHLRAAGEDAAVFCAGVPGYDTDQEEKLLARLEGLVRPTDVVVGWLPNDVLDRRAASGPVHIVDGQMVQDLEDYLAWRDRHLKSALWSYIRVRMKLLRRTANVRHLSAIPDEALALSQAPLRRILERTRALGARPAVVLFPRQEEVEDPSIDASHHARMASFARGLGATCVDMLAVWRAAPAAGRYLERDPVHPTAKGYDEVAAEVARALRQAPE